MQVEDISSSSFLDMVYWKLPYPICCLFETTEGTLCGWKLEVLKAIKARACCTDGNGTALF